MPKTRTQKQTILQDLKKNLDQQKSVVFVDYKGIMVKDLFALRKQLKSVGAKLQVAKKTLLQKAFGERGLKADFKKMEGQVALVYGFEDPFAGIKTAHTFAKSNENLKFLGGFLQGEALSPDQVKELALIPSRQELLSRFVGSLASPLQGLVTVLGGNVKGLITVLRKAKI